MSKECGLLYAETNYDLNRRFHAQLLVKKERRYKEDISPHIHSLNAPRPLRHIYIFAFSNRHIDLAIFYFLLRPNLPAMAVKPRTDRPVAVIGGGVLG